MYKKIYNNLIYIFLGLFLIFPTFSILFNLRTWIVPVILMAFGIVLINFKKIKILENKKFIISVFIIGLLLRIILGFLLSNSMLQFSDFGLIFNRAINFEFPARYYQTASHYLFYTYFLAILFKIFGASQIVAFIFNSIILTLVGIVVYFISKKIFNNKKIATLSAIMWIFWPGNVLYTYILTPDHGCALFLSLGILLIINIVQNIDKFEFKNNIFILLLTGFIISMIAFFKNFSLVLIIALFIILFLMSIKNKKIIKKAIIIFISVLISYTISLSMLYFVAENIINAKITRNQLWSYLYVGIGLENNGVYSQEKYGEIDRYLDKHNMDYDKTNEYFKSKIIDSIKKNPIRYLSLFKYKAQLSFADDGGQSWWIYNTYKPDKIGLTMQKLHSKIIDYVNSTYYVVTIIFMVVMLIYNIVYLKNDKLLFVNIVIFGCCMMLLLAESQGRYKYAFEPLFCIMAAGGIYYIKNLIFNIVDYLKESKI